MKELQTLSSMPITQESEHTLNDITWNFPKKGLKIKKIQKANHPMPLVEMVLSSRPQIHSPRSKKLTFMDYVTQVLLTFGFKIRSNGRYTGKKSENEGQCIPSPIPFELGGNSCP